MDAVERAWLQIQQVQQAWWGLPRHRQQVQQATALLAGCFRAGGKVLACGNGGSMTDAMHFAEELTGRYGPDRPPLPAIAISDAGHISCTANDYGYQQIFARYVQALGQPGDVLLAISTSGNSPNVLEAARTALAQGMQVLALTGKDGGQLAGLATLELRVPHHGLADRIQEVHIQIIHCLIAGIEAELFGQV